MSLEPLTGCLLWPERFLPCPVSALTSQTVFPTNLPHPAQLVHRPISKHGLAVDIALIHRPEIAAVIGHRAMITEHEIALRGHYGLGIGPRVGVGGGQIIPIQSLPFHEDLPAVNADAISRHSNH